MQIKMSKARTSAIYLRCLISTKTLFLRDDVTAQDWLRRIGIVSASDDSYKYIFPAKFEWSFDESYAFASLGKNVHAEAWANKIESKRRMRKCHWKFYSFSGYEECLNPFEYPIDEVSWVVHHKVHAKDAPIAYCVFLSKCHDHSSKR